MTKEAQQQIRAAAFSDELFKIAAENVLGKDIDWDNLSPEELEVVSSLQKHAGIGSWITKGIRKGWRYLTGKGGSTVTKTKPPVTKPPVTQRIKQKVKEYAVPTTIATGTVGAGIYTNEKRRQAADELAKFRADNQFWTSENKNTYDTITGSTQFADSLRTANQIEGLNKIQDLDRRKVQQEGIDNYNVVRYGRAENPVNESDRDYRANLINAGKLDPWLDNPSIVSQKDKERAAELKANKSKKKNQ